MEVGVWGFWPEAWGSGWGSMTSPGIFNIVTFYKTNGVQGWDWIGVGRGAPGGVSDGYQLSQPFVL